MNVAPPAHRHATCPPALHNCLTPTPAPHCPHCPYTAAAPTHTAPNAHLQDPTLASAFRERRDVHAQTAARVFRVPLGAVTPAQRQAGKQVVSE